MFLSFSKETFPVINACAFINTQSSNLGLRWAISDFCKNAFLSKVLNKPVLAKRDTKWGTFIDFKKVYKGF